MNWRILFLIQGFATLATFLLILFDPIAIPLSLGLTVSKENYAFPLLIGVNELALSYLSFAARSIKEISTLKKISTFFIVFHFATGSMCLVALSYGASSKLFANVGFRTVMVLLFAYFGIYKLNKDGQ